MNRNDSKTGRKVMGSIVIGASLAMSASLALAKDSGTALDRIENAGWACFHLPGDPQYHCVDSADARSQNSMAITLKVFDADGGFLGTEQIWSAAIYAGQPCPQDQLLYFPGLVACHHYDTQH